MARAPQTTQAPVGYKLTPVLTEPTADGDVIDAGDVRLLVHNDSLASINVTVQTVAEYQGLPVADLVVAVPAGATVHIGPFPKTAFGQSAGADKGRVYVDYSAQTDVERAVVAS